MNKKLGVFVAAGLLSIVSTSAMAQFAKADDAVEYREAAMTLMSSHFGRMGPVVKKEIPYNKEQIKENVALLNRLAALPWAAYAPGTEGGRAKPEVWSDAEGFKQAKVKYLDSLKPLTVAADAGDFDALRVAFGNTAKSCKACHDSYRAKKK